MRIPVFLLINLAASVSFSPLYASANNAEEQDPIAQPRVHNASPIDVLHAIILRERAREENPRPHGIVQLEDSFEEYNSVERSYGHDEVDDNAGDLEDAAIRIAIKKSLEGAKGEPEPEIEPSLPITDISIDPELDEAIRLSMQTNNDLEKNDTDSSKLHFHLDSDGFPMEATVLRKTHWKAGIGKTLEEIANHLRKKSIMTTKTFLAYGEDALEVYSILGGGDCGFFAYGKGTNRYTFVRDAIDAVLTGSRFPSETRQASVDAIRKIFTQDLIQVVDQQDPNDYLKKLGSEQPFDDLFINPAEPHVLANFIYKCYGLTLECLSTHALKALALMNNHTLYIWQKSPEPEEPNSLMEELSLMQKQTSKSDTTIQIYYDGLGHFMPVIPLIDTEMKRVAHDKSLISEHLKLALEQQGIGAQEYELYTKEMKDLYLALCS